MVGEWKQCGRLEEVWEEMEVEMEEMEVVWENGRGVGDWKR